MAMVGLSIVATSDLKCERLKAKQNFSTPSRDLMPSLGVIRSELPGEPDPFSSCNIRNKFVES